MTNLPMVDARLLRAYRSSRYVADGVAMGIGQRSPAMDALLARLSARRAMFVTAWNPLSRRLPSGTNTRRQRRLEQRLSRYAFVLGTSGEGRWREAQCLVAAPRPVVLRLARLFRQRAVVAIARQQPARLVPLCWPVAMRRSSNSGLTGS